MKKILFIFLSLFTTISCSYAESTDLIGSWVDEEPSNNEGIPIHLFTIKIHKADKNITGEYCYIANYGRREDCNNNFTGNKISNNKYKINFDSSFGGKNGMAEIYYNNKKLHWTLKSHPKNGDYYIPTQTILIMSEKKTKYLEIIVPKTFIYKTPNANHKTKSYLINGDKVLVVDEDNKWIKVTYKNKLLGWIKKEDTQ